DQLGDEVGHVGQYTIESPDQASLRSLPKALVGRVPQEPSWSNVGGLWMNDVCEIEESGANQDIEQPIEELEGPVAPTLADMFSPKVGQRGRAKKDVQNALAENAAEANEGGDHATDGEKHVYEPFGLGLAINPRIVPSQVRVGSGTTPARLELH